MWTLKETPTIEEAQNLQMKATFVFTDGTNYETVSTTVSTVGEVKQSGRDLRNRLNQRSEAIAESKAGTFTIEEEQQTPREKTELEKKQELYEAERAELVKLKEDYELGIADENDVTNKEDAVRNARTEYENARRNA